MKTTRRYSSDELKAINRSTSGDIESICPETIPHEIRNNESPLLKAVENVSNPKLSDLIPSSTAWDSCPVIVVPNSSYTTIVIDSFDGCYFGFSVTYFEAKSKDVSSIKSINVYDGKTVYVFDAIYLLAKSFRAPNPLIKFIKSKVMIGFSMNNHIVQIKKLYDHIDSDDVWAGSIDIHSLARSFGERRLSYELYDKYYPMLCPENRRRPQGQIDLAILAYKIYKPLIHELSSVFAMDDCKQQTTIAPEELSDSEEEITASEVLQSVSKASSATRLTHEYLFELWHSPVVEQWMDLEYEDVVKTKSNLPIRSRNRPKAPKPNPNKKPNDRNKQAPNPKPPTAPNVVAKDDEKELKLNNLKTRLHNKQRQMKGKRLDMWASADHKAWNVIEEIVIMATSLPITTSIK